MPLSPHSSQLPPSLRGEGPTTCCLPTPCTPAALAVAGSNSPGSSYTFCGLETLKSIGGRKTTYLAILTVWSRGNTLDALGTAGNYLIIIKTIHESPQQTCSKVGN